MLALLKCLVKFTVKPSSTELFFVERVLITELADAGMIWWSGFTGVFREPPRATRAWPVLGWAGSEICCEVRGDVTVFPS